MGSAGGRASARSQGAPRLAAVRRVSDERAYLSELIQTIGAGPDLETILRGVVGLVTEATSCHACFVYFLGDDALTLRVASSMYEHLEGTVTIPTGEGLTGWVARARRSAYIKERALEDPRVRRASFPELGDDVYQSLVSVPFFSRAGEVLGVITLHAEAPHEFGRADLDFLEHTASLIAGAVENARLYEDATMRVALLSDLSRLSQAIAAASSQDEVLRTVADGLRSLLGASRCEIHLTGTGGRSRPAIVRVEAGRPVVAAHPMPRGGMGDPAEAPLGGDDTEGAPSVAPLVVGEERLGFVGVRLRRGSGDARSALEAVAAHTSVALKQHQVIDRLREKNLLKDFFRALAGDEGAGEAGALAARLRCDLDSPHILLHVVAVSPSDARQKARGERPAPQRSWADRSAQVEALLVARFPGCLVDTLERSTRAVVPLRRSGAEEVVDEIRDTGLSTVSDALSVGVSDVCRGPGSFARGFQEAEAAAEVGALIRRAPGVTMFEELGPYRYVLGADDDVRDRSQRRLELLVEYDDRRGTQLLDTLEGYLDRRGNVVATSRALFIHANTLRQRLDRIERVTGIDLERDDWLSIAVATKVVKLRRMRRSAGRADGGEGRKDG